MYLSTFFPYLTNLLQTTTISGTEPFTARQPVNPHKTLIGSCEPSELTIPFSPCQCLTPSSSSGMTMNICMC